MSTTKVTKPEKSWWEKILQVTASLEAEPVAEEGVKTEEDTERLDVEGLDC